MQCCHKLEIVETSGKIILQNEGGWFEAPKWTKHGFFTQQKCTKIHDTVPISLFIGERERANLVVYTTVRCPTAHAPGLRASFYPK